MMAKVLTIADRIYHLAEAVNWSSIKSNGSICASKLLDLAGIVGIDRDRWERAQRHEHTQLLSGLLMEGS